MSRHRPGRRARRASASPLFTPHGADRTTRRAARKQLAEARAKAQAAVETTGATAAEAEMPAPLYAPAGRPGTASARGKRLRLPAHRMTTATASGAYPFLAEGGLGAEGIYIGRDVHAEGSFVFDPFSLYGKVEGFTNPNILLAGVIGQGKSALAKSFALRSVAFGYRVYVPCDPKGEWTPVATALGGTSIALGPGLPGRLNPLDAAPKPPSISDAGWAARSANAACSCSVPSPAPSSAATCSPWSTPPSTSLWTESSRPPPPLAERRCSATSPTPSPSPTSSTPQPAPSPATSATLPATSPTPCAASSTATSAGMFDAPSTVAFDPTSPMLSIDLSRLGGSGDDTALVLAMTCASAWMEAALTDPDGGRRWIVYDEAWRLMRHPGLLQRMQAQWKLSRGLGIANLMVIHRLSDLLTAGDAGSQGRALAEGLLADCSTRIIYRQETDQIQAAATLLGLTAVETEAISQLTRGRGLWRVAGRSFVVQHLLHPTEKSLFDTDARMH